MPLLEIVPVQNFGLLGLWNLTESHDELLEIFKPGKEDLNAFEQFHLPLRKQEFLVTRILLKELLSSLNLPYHGVYKDENNKPLLIENPGFISFSHSKTMAAVFYSAVDEVGVDVEIVDERAFRIKHKFLNDSEMVVFGGDNFSCTLAWSMKESLYKIWGRKRLDFVGQLELLELETENALFLGKIKAGGGVYAHRLMYKRYNDCLITFNID